MDLLNEGMCFICGEHNPIGLKVPFDIDKENLTIEGLFTPKREHQGYRGIMHGGLVAALLDEAMVKLLWEAGIPSVSAELNIRLARPVKVGEPLRIKGWVDSSKGRVVFTRAKIEDHSGNLLAEGKGKCVKVLPKEERSVGSNQEVA